MSDAMESELAQMIDVSSLEAKYDAAAKKLVAQKSILAYILKSTMDEFASVSVKQIAEELIEGSPQVAEVAVHQDTPDAPNSDYDRLSGSGRVTDMATEDVSIREGTVRYDILSQRGGSITGQGLSPRRREACSRGRNTERFRKW